MRFAKSVSTVSRLSVFLRANQSAHQRDASNPTLSWCMAKLRTLAFKRHTDDSASVGRIRMFREPEMAFLPWAPPEASTVAATAAASTCTTCLSKHVKCFMSPHEVEPHIEVMEELCKAFRSMRSSRGGAANAMFVEHLNTAMRHMFALRAGCLFLPQLLQVSTEFILDTFQAALRMTPKSARFPVTSVRAQVSKHVPQFERGGFTDEELREQEQSGVATVRSAAKRAREPEEVQEQTRKFLWTCAAFPTAKAVGVLHEMDRGAASGASLLVFSRWTSSLSAVTASAAIRSGWLPVPFDAIEELEAMRRADTLSLSTALRACRSRREAVRGVCEPRSERAGPGERQKLMLWMCGALNKEQRAKVQRVAEAMSAFASVALMCTTGVAQTALNLPWARLAILCEPLWNPQVETQAGGRINRLMQRAPEIRIVRMLSCVPKEGTVAFEEAVPGFRRWRVGAWAPETPRPFALLCAPRKGDGWADDDGDEAEGGGDDAESASEEPPGASGDEEEEPRAATADEIMVGVQTRKIDASLNTLGRVYVPPEQIAMSMKKSGSTLDYFVKACRATLAPLVRYAKMDKARESDGGPR